MVSLIAISVYSYHKTNCMPWNCILCFVLCTHYNAHSTDRNRNNWNKNKMEKKVGKIIRQDFHSLKMENVVRNILYWLVCDAECNAHKNYDNKFFVCSNLMSIFFVGSFFHYFFFFFGIIANTKQKPEKMCLQL